MKQQPDGHPQAHPLGGFAVRVAVFLGVFLLVAEVFFRTVLPASEMPVSRYDAAHGILRYDPSIQQQGRYSSGRYAQALGSWHINASGWNSHREYLPAAERRKPAVAYFGSSFVEGFYNLLDENIAFVMEKLGGGRYDVYNFGMSDSVPSEHLEVAAYARDAFGPEVMVFFCSPWHVAATLIPAPGRQRWQLTDGVVSKRPLVPRNTSRLRALGRRSALLRYLIFNAEFRPEFAPGSAAAKPFGGNAAQGGSATELPPADLKALAETMVQRAVREHPKAKVVFVTGGPHMSDAPPVMDPASRAVAQACAAHGADHIDLSTVFHAHWLAHHERFDFAHNFHWNALAFRIIAERLDAYVRGVGI